MTKAADGVLARFTDEDVGIIERQSYQFHTTFGQKVHVPPQYYQVLKSRGVNMKYIEEDPSLEQ
jgi:hypothetical protein